MNTIDVICVRLCVFFFYLILFGVFSNNIMAFELYSSTSETDEDISNYSDDMSEESESSIFDGESIEAYEINCLTVQNLNQHNNDKYDGDDEYDYHDIDNLIIPVYGATNNEMKSQSVVSNVELKASCVSDDNHNSIDNAQCPSSVLENDSPIFIFCNHRHYSDNSKLCGIHYQLPLKNRNQLVQHKCVAFNGGKVITRTRNKYFNKCSVCTGDEPCIVDGDEPEIAAHFARCRRLKINPYGRKKHGRRKQQLKRVGKKKRHIKKKKKVLLAHKKTHKVIHRTRKIQTN